MGAANKLLAEVGGKPMVRIVVETALASAARPVLVVTGHQAAEVRAALAGLDVTFCANPDYALGLSTSLKAGIRAVPATCAGALVLLGDMPRITPAHLDALIAAFAPGTGADIVVPTHRGAARQPGAVVSRLLCRDRCSSMATPAPAAFCSSTPTTCARSTSARMPSPWTSIRQRRWRD